MSRLTRLQMLTCVMRVQNPYSETNPELAGAYDILFKRYMAGARGPLPKPVKDARKAFEDAGIALPTFKGIKKPKAPAAKSAKDSPKAATQQAEVGDKEKNQAGKEKKARGKSKVDKSRYLPSLRPQ